MMNRLTGTFFHWLPIGVTIVALTGLIYVVTQQTYRTNMNDPQVEMVNNLVMKLDAHEPIANIVPKDKVDVTTSLSPFVGIYDQDGNPIEVSGTLGPDPLPTPPNGIFNNEKSPGQNRVTWQPNANTRIALVLKQASVGSNDFVVAGRNMREVENRIHNLTSMMGLALIVTLIASFIADLIGDWYRRKMMAAMQEK